MPVFSSLRQLAAALREQAAGGHGIELTQAAIWGTSTRVPDLMASHLGRSDLKFVVAADAIPKEPTGNLMTVTVSTPKTEKDTFLSLIGIDGCTICLDLDSDHDDEVNLVLTIPLPKPPGWTLAQSWPGLASDPVVAVLPFTSPQLVFDSHPSAGPLSFSSPLSLTDTTSGLNLVSELLPDVTLPTVTLAGEIAPGPGFDLRFDLLDAAPPPLGDVVRIGKPYLGLRSLTVPYLKDEEQDGAREAKTYVAAQWLVGADVELGPDAAALTLGAVPRPSLPGFSLEILPATPEGTTLESLVAALLCPLAASAPDAFKGLFGSVPFVTQVYDDLMSAFAFKGFSAMFMLGSGGGIQYVLLEVGSTLDDNGKPKYQLPIIPGGVLTADEFDLQWIVYQPASSSPTMLLTITARLTFAKDFPFDLSVTLPNFTVDGKYVGDPITLSLAELEQKLFGGDVSIPLGFDVTFTALELQASPPSAYTMTVAAGADVSLFGTSVLAISNATLTITRKYAEGSTTPENAFAFHGIIALGPLAFDVSAQIGDGDTVFTIHTVGLTVGGLLTELVRLVDPYLDLRLEPPWDKLTAISLDALVLEVNVTQGTVSVDYPIDLDLGFVTITAIGLKYARAKDATPSSLEVDLDCKFLGIEYGGSSGKPGLGWNPVTERAPAVPGAGSKLFDLQYVALGQHVTVTGGDLTTIANVFKALRGTVVPLSPGATDPTTLPGVAFSAESQWLIAAQFSVLGTVTLSGVFNDPSLAGIRIALDGEKAGPFAGLEFEILYTKVTPTIGLYHVELKLPDAMRHLEFGEVSVTLPIVVLDVYTNGNFRIDFGFPQGLDFSRSFSVQVFPFVGYGGFYFALLNGQTSKRVPQITNGQFNPVIEFGVGLSLGVGKTIEEGVFSAGASVTVVGIVQGVIGWFEPSSSAATSDRYYWIQGMVALTGQVFGKVDFAIISVDVQIKAQASVTLTIEAYEPIHIALVASVSVEASIKILFFRIHFSFSMTLNLAFDIGSKGTPPWQVAQGDQGNGASQQPQLLAQTANAPQGRPVHLAVHGSRRAFLGLATPPPPAASAARLDAVAFAARSVAHLLAGGAPEKQALDVVLVPAFTRGDGGGPVECVLLPFVETSIPSGAHTAAETQEVASAAADASFNQLAVRLFAWAMGALGDHVDGPESVVTADDLDAVATTLYDPDVEQGPFSYPNLKAFFDANFDLRLFGRTPNATGDLSGAIFPMPIELTLSAAGQTIDFAVNTPVDAVYQQTIDAYLQQLAVAYESDVEAAHGGGGADARPAARAAAAADSDDVQSMAQLVFGNWCTMVARAAVNAAVAITRAYPYAVPQTGTTPSLTAIAASFPPATGIHVCAEGDTLDTLAAAHGTNAAAIRALNRSLPAIGDDEQLPVGLRLTLPVVATPASIVAANTANAGLLGGSVPLPLNGVQVQAGAGASFMSIATTLAAVPQLRAKADTLAAALLAANTGAAILQPGAQTPLTPPAYHVQDGDTITIVAATYLVRTGGASVVNLVTGLPELVKQLITANPKVNGTSWGPTEPLADGTQVKVPTTVVPSGVRVARLGDTMTRIAGSVLAPEVPGVDLLPTISALVAANPSLGSADPTAPLPAGTTLAVPPLTAIVQPGDTLDGIATSFGFAGGASVGTPVLEIPGVLATGAVLAVPPLAWTATAEDTFGAIAEQLNLTIDDLAASIAGTAGVLAPGQTLTVPHVPALALGDLQSQLLLGADLNTTAASVSRFLLHGLRLPNLPARTLSAEALAGAGTSPLYALVGQQFAAGDGDVVLTPHSGAAIELYMAGYVVQAGDDLARIVGRFALAGQGDAFTAALQQLNPGVDLSGLMPGQALVFPGASSYRTVTGDTLAGITARFAAAGMNDLFDAELQQRNPLVDLSNLAPDTQLELPIADSTTTVLGDTPEAVAARFVPPASVSAFVGQLVELNTGVAPGTVIPADTVLALPQVALRLPVQELQLSWSASESAVITRLERESFDATATVARLPLYDVVPTRWSLPHLLHWQAAVPPGGSRFAGAPAAGEPTVWPFPTALQTELVAAGTNQPVLELVTARSDVPADRATTTPVGTYAWGTAVDFGVRQVDGTDGPLPNRYVVTGADEAGRNQLELLWQLLQKDGTPSAFLLYPPSPAGGNPAGLTSDALDGDLTFVLQANLSTLSTSGAGVPVAADALGEPTPRYQHSATLADPAGLVKLLWECSVVHGGGYYLEYVTADGNGLPADLFRKGPEATVTLLVLVDENVAPPAPPPVRAAHNCAVVGTNVDAGTTDVFAQPVVHVASAGDTLHDVVRAVAERSGVQTTADAIAAANADAPGIVRAGEALRREGTLAVDRPIFRPGATLHVGAAPTRIVASAPPGTSGFHVLRADPGQDEDTSGIDTLFQLLAFSIEGTGGFRASAEALPAGPSSDDGGGSATWEYRKLFPVARFADDGLAADPPTGVAWTLPSPWLDPYRGIAPGREVTVDLSFRDVYGNVAGGSGVLAPFPIRVGYFDDLIGVGSWPSVAVDYEFVAGAHEGDPPQCVLDLAFDPTHYVPSPGLSAEAAARNAAARRVRFAQIHYQLRQQGVQAVLRSSLDQPSPAKAGDPLPPPTPYALQLATLRTFVASVHAFLCAAEGLAGYAHPVSETDTLGELAQQYTVTLPELATANAGVDVSLLFAQGTLSVPVFVHLAQGETLRQAGVTAAQLTQASMDAPLTEGADLSLASQPGSYTLGATDSLRHVAAQAHALPASIATANPDHPLTKGTTLVAGGTSLAVGDDDTLTTMVQRFGALTPPIATTTGDLGTANQDVPGLFDTTRLGTLTIADRLAGPGETLRTITTGTGAPVAANLAQDNLDLPGIYPPTAALWTSNTAYALQPGDTLGGVAARFGIDLATLASVAANAAAPLTAAHGCTLAVPGQVVFGQAGPPASIVVLSGAPSADLVARNRYTHDLLVAGSLTVGSVPVSVDAADLLDTVYARAVASGYPSDFAQFAQDASAAIARGAQVLAAGAAWVAPPLTIGAGSGGASAETLDAVAARAGVTTDVLVRSNGALRGVLRPQAPVTFGGVTLQATADDTLTTLAARFTAQGAPVTLDTLASHPALTGGDMLTAGAPLVPAAFTGGENVTFTATPQNPEVIFAVDVQLELARPTDRTDPDFATVESVVLASTRVAAKAEPSDDAVRTLADFAEHFEAAFPGLKAAVSQRRGGIAEQTDTGQVWAADFRSGKLSFAVQQGDGVGPNPNAAYFALKPLATDLLSYADVEIQPYTTGQPLGAAAKHTFSSVDLDAWMSQFLSVVDGFLAAASAPAARVLQPALVDQIIADKQRIADHLSDSVGLIYDGGPTGNLADAQDALRQAMLVSLGSAYSVSTIVQLPVTVTAPGVADPSTAPRLSGAPVSAKGDSEEAAPYTLSTAKVPLVDGTEYVTFTVSAKQPATDRVLDLDLRYAVTEIEHDIANVTGIADYQRSSWLTLLRPLPPGPETIGPLAVPVPLRANPVPPTMVAQTATASATDGSTASQDQQSILDRLKRWDYGFSFEHPTADQDTRSVSVTFNGPPPSATAAAPRAGNLDQVFAALAQYTSVAGAVQTDLGPLTTVAPDAGAAATANAVAVFADLVHRVADALAPAGLQLQGTAEDAGITLDYTVSVDGDVMTLALASAPPASVGWPDVAAVVEGMKQQLTGAKADPKATSRAYTYPTGVPPSTPGYAWTFRSLDVTQLQSGVSAMRVVRNQNLGGQTGQTVNTDFVYETAVAEFASPVVPLLVRQVAVPIGNPSGTVETAIRDVFIDLFGPLAGGWSADVQLAGSYGYGMGQPASKGAAAPFTAALPIFVITRHTVTAKDVPALAAQADALLSKWSSDNHPNPTGGTYVFELTTYSAQPAHTGPPVLDLQNLIYSLTE